MVSLFAMVEGGEFVFVIVDKLKSTTSSIYRKVEFRAHVRVHVPRKGRVDCPCKGEGLQCGSRCTCGSTAKHCRDEVCLLRY